MFVLGLLLLPHIVRAVDHLLISEVQITGGSGATDQDFVELYNPTTQLVDLNGYRLVKRTATGTSDTVLKAWSSSAVIPAGGYYLWANSSIFSTIIPDETSAGTLADNNSIALRKGENNIGDIIDAVGWGSATGVFIKGSVFPTNPGAKQSLERKAGSDVGNNAEDFFIQVAPNPMSTKSAQTVPTVESPVTPPGGAVISVGSLLINEVFPAPTSGNEWIEIMNTTAEAINLAGLVLEDGAGPVVHLTGSIPGKSLFVFELTSAKLNNNGDRIRLVSAGTELDAVSYGKWNDGNIEDNASGVKANQAVARKTALDTGNDSQDFAGTQEPTKGLPNIIVQPEIVNRGSASRPVKTTPGAVMRINELMIDPGDNDTEWVEIYNAGETSVELSGWTIEDGSGSKLKLSGTWIPGHYYVIKDIPGALNNSGDVVIVRDDKGEVHDRVSYGSWDDGNRADNAGTVTDPQSLGRRADGYDTGIDSKDFIALAPSRGSTNAAGVPSDIVTIPDGGVLISEVSPMGSLPFAELKNTTDSYLRLSGWFLKDAKGNQIDLSGVLVPPRGYFAVALDEYGVNTKGTLTLYDQKRHQKDKITYRGASLEKSYALVAGDWHWGTPSPDRENSLDPVVVELPPLQPVAPTVLIAAAKQTIKKPMPGAKKAAAKPAVVPTLTPLSAVNDALLGRAVRAMGTVSEKKGNIVVIKDGDHMLRVSLASVNYGGQKVNPMVGDRMTATGILKKSNAGLRIVPWQVSQIMVEKPKPPEPKPELVALVSKPEPKPKNRTIPWPAIGMALMSTTAAVAIKGGVSFKKAREYAAILRARLRTLKGED